MLISAEVRNGAGNHHVTVATAGRETKVEVPCKPTGHGSALNGGELLMLALATCYCNDLYREAQRLGIAIDGCQVIARASFDGIGVAAESITYCARVDSSAPARDIERLLSETDRLAEVHNTLRQGCRVQRVAWNGEGH